MCKMAPRHVTRWPSRARLRWPAASSAFDRPTDQSSAWNPAPAGLKGGRPPTHHHDCPRSSPRSHPPHLSPHPSPRHYSALHHLWLLRKWPTTSSATPPARGTCFATRGPAAAIVVALPPRLPLLRPTSPPPRCTRGASNVIDPGRTMRTFLASFCRW